MLFQTRLGLMLPFTFLLAVSASAKPVSHKTATKAPASKSLTVRRELQTIYNKMNAEAMQRNVDGLYEYDSDDYTIIDAKGHVHDASEGRQDLETVLEQVDRIQVVTTIQGFTGTDTEATVSVKDQIVLVFANNANHRAIKLNLKDTARDHWIKTEDGWRRTRTRVLSGKNTFSKNF